MSTATMVAVAVLILLALVSLALLVARRQLGREIRELQARLKERQAALACIDQLEAERDRLCAALERLLDANGKARAAMTQESWQRAVARSHDAEDEANAALAAARGEAAP